MGLEELPEDEANCLDKTLESGAGPNRMLVAQQPASSAFALSTSHAVFLL